MKIKEGVKEKLFGQEKEIILTKDNIENFFVRMMEAEEYNEEKENNIAYGKFTPDDLPRVADAVVCDLVSHLTFVAFVEKLLKEYNAGELDHAPLYNTQEQVDKYKIESCKLFHSLCIKLRLARLFGFGDIEGVVTVVDTGKLPSIEKAKKMEKKLLIKALEDASHKTDVVAVDSAKIFEKDGKKKAK